MDKNKVIQDFLRHMRDDRIVSDHTLSAYRTDLTAFAGYIGDSLLTVRPKGIERYIEHLRATQSYKDSTLARKLASVKSLYFYLSARGWIESDPTKPIPSIRVEPRQHDYLTQDEIDTLILAVVSDPSVQSKRDLVIIRLLTDMGLRVSEVMGLDLADVNRYQGTLAIGARSLLMPQDVALVMWDYLDHTRQLLAGRRNDPALILQYRNGRLSRQGVWLILKERAGKAGIDPARITPNALRRSFAVNMINSGAAIDDVRDALGHSSIHTTRRYVEVG